MDDKNKNIEQENALANNQLLLMDMEEEKRQVQMEDMPFSPLHPLSESNLTTPSLLEEPIAKNMAPNSAQEYENVSPQSSDLRRKCNWVSSENDIESAISEGKAKSSSLVRKDFTICQHCLSNRRDEFSYEEIIHDDCYPDEDQVNSRKEICICSKKLSASSSTNQQLDEDHESVKIIKESKKNQTCDIDLLPDEIMLQIFSYFTPTELCRYVAPVCVTWLQYARDSSLWEVITQEEFKNVPSDLLVKVITSWCALLKSIDFKCRTDMAISDFELIFKSCPLIEKISFAFCTQVDDDFLKLCAHYCHHLKFINTEGCPISDSSIIFLFGKPIHGLNASHCTMISDDGLIFLAQNFRNLTQINLDGIQWISQASIEVLVELHGESLTEIFLDGAEMIDDTVRLLSRCQNLRKFSFSFCDTLTDFSLEWIKQFKRLEYLQLKKGANFTNTGILRLLTSFKDLEGRGLTYLNLAECTALSDECLHAISESCPNLQILNLSWCWEVTDDGINFIFDSCHKLTELHLCGLHELYGIPFRRIEQELPKLQYLDLRQCNKTSDDMLVNLSFTIKSLTILNYYGDIMNYELNFWNLESKCSPGHFHHTAF